MGRSPYKMLNKKDVDEHVQKKGKSLYVETFTGAQPVRYLNCLTHKGNRTIAVCLGRVPKTIHKWYKLIMMDEQPPAVNMRWEKFDLTPVNKTDEEPAGSDPAPSQSKPDNNNDNEKNETDS